MDSFAPLMDHLSLYSEAGASHHPIVGVCSGQPGAVGANCTIFATTNFNPTLNYFYNYFSDKVLGYDSLVDMTLWPNIIFGTLSIFNHTFIFSLWIIVAAFLFFNYLSKFDGIIKQQQNEFAN